MQRLVIDNKVVSYGKVLKKDEIIKLYKDAVRIMKKLYGIDMEANGQHSKLISDIPEVDYAISMGCNVGCPFIGKAFDDNWGLDDPTGKDDEAFICVARQIEEKIMELKDRL